MLLNLALFRMVTKGVHTFLVSGGYFLVSVLSWFLYLVGCSGVPTKLLSVLTFFFCGNEVCAFQLLFALWGMFSFLTLNITARCIHKTTHHPSMPPSYVALLMLL